MISIYYATEVADYQQSRMTPMLLVCFDTSRTVYSKRVRDNAVNDMWLAHNMSHSLQGGYIHSHVTDPPAPVIKLMHLADEAEA